MLDGRYPFRISSPGQAPIDATLVISGRSWSVTMYPWSPIGSSSPLTISGESDDARDALLLLVGAEIAPLAPAAAVGRAASVASMSATAPQSEIPAPDLAQRPRPQVIRERLDAADQTPAPGSGVTIVDSGRRDPDRGVVYHIATGGLVHLLTLLGNSLVYAESSDAVIVPAFELGYEWGATPFRDFFQPLSPAIADAALETGLLAELPNRLRLPIATCRDIRTQWLEGGTGDCLELVGDLAGALTLGLPWGTRLQAGQAVLTAGCPWPPDGMPRGYGVALERIAVNDRVRDEIARRTADLPERYIGAHFRNTDIASDLADVANRVREAASETGISDVVWATDDIDTREEAAALLPGLRLHPASALPSIRESGQRALHFMRADHLGGLGFTKDDVNLAAVSDLYALVRADVFVPTGAPVVGIMTGWTGFVEHLRARPNTAESFFRLPVGGRQSAPAAPEAPEAPEEEAPAPVVVRSREDLHVPAEEADAARDLLRRRRDAGEEPEPSALLAAMAQLRGGDPDRDAFGAFVEFAEPLAPLSAAPAFEDLWALWEAKGALSGFYVEIGGGNGIDGSASFLLERRARWGGIVVEADAARAEEARMNRNCIVLHAWASAGPDAEAALAAVEVDGRRRLVRIDEGKRPGRRKRSPDAAATVRAMTLEAILEEAAAPERIDILVLRSGDAPAKLLRDFHFARRDVGTIAIGADAATDGDDLAGVVRAAGYRAVWPEFSQPGRWYTRD